MADLLTLENLGNLLMLCFLQAVLGFDNLLYISIESQRAPVAHQRTVRFWGILIAVALRVILLFTMIQLIDALSEPFYVFNWVGILEGGINFATIVFVLGGIFIMYTAVKEIGHMLTVEHLDEDVSGRRGKSALQVIVFIVMMNLIFSFDSILSALAITDVFPILATAILLSGLAMVLLADGVTKFLEKNRMYEVLGLFILLIVGVVLPMRRMMTRCRSLFSDMNFCQCPKRPFISPWSCWFWLKLCNPATAANWPPNAPATSYELVNGGQMTMLTAQNGWNACV